MNAGYTRYGWMRAFPAAVPVRSWRKGVSTMSRLATMRIIELKALQIRILNIEEHTFERNSCARVLNRIQFVKLHKIYWCSDTKHLQVLASEYNIWVTHLCSFLTTGLKILATTNYHTCPTADAWMPPSLRYGGPRKLLRSSAMHFPASLLHVESM